MRHEKFSTRLSIGYLHKSVRFLLTAQLLLPTWSDLQKCHKDTQRLIPSSVEELLHNTVLVIQNWVELHGVNRKETSSFPNASILAFKEQKSIVTCIFSNGG